MIWNILIDASQKYFQSLMIARRQARWYRAISEASSLDIEYYAFISMPHHYIDITINFYNTSTLFRNNAIFMYQ